MDAAATNAESSAMASTTLKPDAHQTIAVYGAMLPQPHLRFLLADEPGTGKTIMAGLYIREMQRLGLVLARDHRVPGRRSVATIVAALRHRPAR